MPGVNRQGEDESAGDGSYRVGVGGSLGKCMSMQAMESLYELRLKGMLCDATIRLEDGSAYPVHRAILSACSMYFRSLFTTSLHEKEQTDVMLWGVQSDVMSALLEYAYLRRIEITANNVSQVLATADYLSILGVLELCCDFLAQNMNPYNVVGILMFARDHFCSKLEQAAFKYVMRNFLDVAAKNQELLALSAEEVTQIICNDELNVKNEENVWELILRWVEADPATRKREIVRFMRQIRLGLMDTQYFLEKVKDHPHVVGNEECRPIIIETLKFMYDLEMITRRVGEMRTPEIARPRIPHEVLFAIGGWSGGSPTNFIETYDTRADRWVQVESVDSTGPRAYHGTAVIGHDIYVIGGFDGMDYFNSCRCFNAVTQTWREIAPMNSRRCYVSVTVLGNMIYAMGGYDGHHRQNTAERYNYETNQWSMIAPMNAQRSDASATTLNGKIYITGGFNGQECMNSAEMYDPDTNMWALVPPMRSRRSGVSCVAYHDTLYVLGGFNGISRMNSGEKFSPQTNVWTSIPDMYNPRSNFAIEVIDDMIFAIGGFNGVTTIYHVECYDDKTNEWYEATDMNIYRSALSASVMRDLPNVWQYIHQHRDQLMEEKRQRLLMAEQGRPQRGIGHAAPIDVNVQVNQLADDDDDNIHHGEENPDEEDNEIEIVD